MCRQPVVECDDASKYQRLNLEPHCEADRMCKFFKLRSNKEIMVKKIYSCRWSCCCSSGFITLIARSNFVTSDLYPQNVLSKPTSSDVSHWSMFVCSVLQLIDHPPRTVQTPTMRSGGYGSIGRSSPKVGVFLFFPEGSSQKIRSRNNHWWYLAYSFMLICLFSAVQSTSVCGEDIQHAH